MAPRAVASLRTAHRLIPVMLKVQTPIVCRVQGWAAGIGFQLALAADFTVAADDAQDGLSAAGYVPLPDKFKKRLIAAINAIR